MSTTASHSLDVFKGRLSTRRDFLAQMALGLTWLGILTPKTGYGDACQIKKSFFFNEKTGCGGRTQLGFLDLEATSLMASLAVILVSLGCMLGD